MLQNRNTLLPASMQTLSTEIMTKPAMLADFVAALCPSDLEKAQAVLCEMNIRMSRRAQPLSLQQPEF